MIVNIDTSFMIYQIYFIDSISLLTHHLKGYYQRLDSTQQGTILGFLNMLSDELHKITYGQPLSSTNDPCNSITTSLSAAPIQSAASSTDENEVCILNV